MPNIVTESARPLDDTVEAGTRFEFMLFASDHPAVVNVAADPENPTLAERLFVRAHISIDRDDDVAGGFRVTSWFHWSDSLPGINTAEAAALRSTLVTLYGAAVSSLGL